MCKSMKFYAAVTAAAPGSVYGEWTKMHSNTHAHIEHTWKALCLCKWIDVRRDRDTKWAAKRSKKRKRKKEWSHMKEKERERLWLWERRVKLGIKEAKKEEEEEELEKERARDRLKDIRRINNFNDLRVPNLLQTKAPKMGRRKVFQKATWIW